MGLYVCHPEGGGQRSGRLGHLMTHAETARILCAEHFAIPFLFFPGCKEADSEKRENRRGPEYSNTASFPPKKPGDHKPREEFGNKEKNTFGMHKFPVVHEDFLV